VCCSVLQCVAVCCSVLQCVAVCCSVLQCVEVCVALLNNIRGVLPVCQRTLTPVRELFAGVDVFARVERDVWWCRCVCCV